MSYTFQEVIDLVIPHIAAAMLKDMEDEIFYASPEGKAQAIKELEDDDLIHYKEIIEELKSQSDQEWLEESDFFQDYGCDRVLWERRIAEVLLSYRKKIMCQLGRLIKDGMEIVEIGDKVNPKDIDYIERGCQNRIASSGGFSFLVKTPKGDRLGRIVLGYDHPKEQASKDGTEVRGWLYK